MIDWNRIDEGLPDAWLRVLTWTPSYNRGNGVTIGAHVGFHTGGTFPVWTQSEGEHVLVPSHWARLDAPLVDPIEAAKMVRAV